MKRVLVPLDGTENAEEALAWLEHLCAPGDLVVLLSVKRPENPERIGGVPGRVVTGGFAGPSGGVVGIATPDASVFAETTDQVSGRQLSEARDYLESLADGMRRPGLEVKTETLIADDPAEMVVRYARQMKPTFITVCRRTHFGISELVFGSATMQLLQAEVAPVLFVPPAPARTNCA